MFFVRRTKTEVICRDIFSYNSQKLAHCYNDRNCKLYGDCCQNSKYYNKLEQTVIATAGGVHNNSLYGCHETHGIHMATLMIGKCPPTISDRKVRKKCENRDDDFITGYPVTSNDTGHTYKNVYCAWCHGEQRRVIYWKPLFQCSGRVVRLEDASDRTLLYRDGQWYYADYGNRTLLTCYFKLQPPEGVPALRPCVVNVDYGQVDGCPVGTPATLAQACASHTYTLFHYPNVPNGKNDQLARVFRNAYCAQCNNVTTDWITCVPPPPSLKTGMDFGSLFAIKAAGKRREPCNPEELYDVLAYKCRNVIRDELSGTCRTSVVYELGEYDARSLDNGTAYVYAYRKRIRYVQKRTPMAVNGSLEVCTEDTNGMLQSYTPPSYTTYLMYVGVVGSSASTVALVAHLALFGTGSEPKNLPAKNLASLAVSLLLGYTCYLAIALEFVSAGKGLPCLVSALAMHFGFLAAFAWMFVMSADVWIVLYAANKKFRVADGKRNGRFAVYSAFAWLAPATITAFVAALQLSTVKVLPELRPNLQYSCWFRNPQSLVALFVLPAGITIAANYVSFVGAVQLISTSGDGLQSTNSSGVSRTRNNLKIYMRLSLMMGLAWVFGLAGAVTDSDIVWMLYTVLNSLQGAFIFFAFDCNWNTVRTLAVFRKLQSVSETQTTTAATPLSATN